jgi:2-methylcitrate dehydratase PrpD
MYSTQVLADYIHSYRAESLSSDVKDKVICCLLDLITAAVVGYNVSACAGIRDVASMLFADGTAPIWFSGRSLNETGAAVCNASAASVLDFDDGHRAARGHPGAAVIPSTLSVATQTNAGADEIFAAIALGYEVGVRIAAAQNPNAIRSRQSGRWTGCGAVAAAGRLYRTDPAKFAHALAIAGVSAPNQDANGSSGYSKLTGNDVKEGIPWSVVTGMTALKLAESGFSGPLDIFDHPSHFDTGRIVNDLNTPLEITRVYFKPYSCCRYIHPAIDALKALMTRHDLRPDDIRSLEVHTFQWAQQLRNSPDPVNLIEIQYSLRYCLAITILHGSDSLAPITPELLHRPDLIDFAGRVHLIVDEAIDKRFPAETLARVTVVTARGDRLVSPETRPCGDADCPMTWDDLREKLLKVTRLRLLPRRQASILDALAALRQGNAKPFLDDLRKPLGG